MKDGPVRKRHDVACCRDATPDRPHRMHPPEGGAVGGVKVGFDCHGGRIGQFSLR